ncbi:MAG: LytTR family DNA-binding domain-containing protein [Bacteroidota bacterium]|nr:LytTR family DNA-binding domain-containing protein [Bacteroidota bacterium]
MVRCIIVDDEEKARENLRILLQDFCENVEVVGMAQNVAQGIEQINQNKPDVLFLDIQMQKETGFDLLNKIGSIDFEIIFTTAYSEYAIKAFKFSALDYLLKPIDIEELQKAVKKVEKKVAGNSFAKIESLIKNLKTDNYENYKLALPTGEGLFFIKIQEILYLEADSNYTTFFMIGGQKYIVSKTLKEYEEMLEGLEFFRIHHSYLINLKEIKKYVKGDGGYVVMSNDVSLDVSKRKKEAFLTRIKL